MTSKNLTYGGTVLGVGLLIVTALAARVWQQPTSRSASAPTVADASPHATRPVTSSFRSPPDEPLRAAWPRSAEPGELPQGAAPGTLEVSRTATAVQFPLGDAGTREETPPAPLAAQLSPLARGGDISGPEIGPAPTSAPARRAVAWPRATRLLTELEKLQHHRAGFEWAGHAMEQLKRLEAQPRLVSGEGTAVLGELESLTEIARGHTSAMLVSAVGAPPIHVGPLAERWLSEQLLQTQYSLTRRLDVWKLAEREARRGPLVVDARQVDWPATLEDVRRYLAEGDQADSWSLFLALPQLEQHASLEASAAAARRVPLARTVLARIEDPALNLRQRKYLAHRAIERLAAGLSVWAHVTPDYPRLLHDLERLEAERSPAAEQAVLAHLRNLRWSPKPGDHELADCIEAHYRNANLRIAVTGDCLNRLLPLLEPFEQPVAENILGAETRGHTRGRGRLVVRLLPDPHGLNLGLEAEGELDSETRSTSWPATFFNQGRSWFQARKQLRLGRDGVAIEAATAQAASNACLTGLETEFDGLPLLGGIARHVAQQQYELRLAEARMVTDRRVAGMAEKKLDAEFAAKLHELENHMERHLTNPLNELNLQLTPLQLQTTPERITVRYRLAGSTQLAAATARPRAPGDALLSMQIHESAVNNLLDRLNFAGRSVELRDLYHEVATLFGAEEAPVPEDIPEGVLVRFAEERPIHVQLDEGRMAVCIRLAELAHERRRWRNFEVRGFYAPDTTKLSADLRRDGHLELLGDSMRISDRIALSGVFSKVFSQNRPLSLLNALAEHPRLKELQLSQFTVRDGWLGVALSERLAERDLVAEELHPPRR